MLVARQEALGQITQKWQHELVNKDSVDVMNTLEVIDDAFATDSTASILNDPSAPYWAQRFVTEVDPLSADEIADILAALYRTFDY
jgi:hypothetical protein